MDLSIIVPAYNESKNIRRTIWALKKYLKKFPQNTEVIIVCDGSLDDTEMKARKMSSEKIKVFGYKKNRGKGHALKYGFSKCSGNLVVFFDAGLDFKPKEILRFIKYLETNKADVVVGSKRHPLSRVDYPIKRKILSRAGQLITRLLFNLKIRDTQAGIKLFRREVLGKIAPLVLIKRYAFDIELLALTEHFKYKITEAPIELNFNFSSTGINSKAVFKTLWDTLAIFYRLRILRYYDRIKKN